MTSIDYLNQSLAFVKQTVVQIERHGALGTIDTSLLPESQGRVVRRLLGDLWFQMSAIDKTLGELALTDVAPVHPINPDLLKFYETRVLTHEDWIASEWLADLFPPRGTARIARGTPICWPGLKRFGNHR